MRSLDARGRARGRRRARADANAQIRENGVTYNVYGDPKGVDRPWELDPLPLLIAGRRMGADRSRHRAARRAAQSRCWPISTAPQTLLSAGAAAAVAGVRPPRLPAAVRTASAPRGGMHLHLLRGRPGALARRPLVGAGRPHAGAVGRGLRAREPASSISRVFPQTFRELPGAAPGVVLSRAARHAACAGAAAATDQPRVVLLTPGPYNETYFEHAYLARYLGFTLVEGSDLTVRDGRVFMKTLERPAAASHAILRRLDDDFCDPLELRSDSSLGVAGLIECARRGNVLLANALGSGVLESGALLGFLPRLAASCSASRCCCRRSPPGGAASRPRSTTPGERLDRADHQAARALARASGRCSASDLSRRRARGAARAHRGAAAALRRAGMGARVAGAGARAQRARREAARARAPSACASSRSPRPTATASCPAA